MQMAQAVPPIDLVENLESLSALVGGVMSNDPALQIGSNCCCLTLENEIN